MNYELFRQITEERFMDYMPENFKDCRLEIIPVQKVNKSMGALHIIPPDENERMMIPTIYVNDMYDKYIQLDNLEKVFEQTADEMERAFANVNEKAASLDFENAKENIIMVLINTEQNQRMLKDIPHRDFQDLSVIYRWVVGIDMDGIKSTVVNDQLAERLGMDETELYNASFENTKRLLPPTIKSMKEVMSDMMMGEGMSKEMIDAMVEESPVEMPMYIISNERGINGASSILYEDGLYKLAEKIRSDLYILPSSIHEVIAISTNMGDPHDLAQMVTDINMDQVSLDERLSNQVYHYDKTLREVTLATDIPNKRLDGIVLIVI